MRVAQAQEIAAHMASKSRRDNPGHLRPYIAAARDARDFLQEVFQKTHGLELEFMKEDLAKGYVRDNLPLDFKGFDVVALNVTKLRSDNFDPHEYLTRLDYWRGKVEKGGGRWRVINDLDRLDGLL